MRIFLAVVALLGCGRSAPQIECGKGTVLKGTVCEVAPVAPAPAADASITRDSAVRSDAGDELSTTWTYETKTDAMRGTTSSYATIVSTNAVDFAAPYGTARLALILRHDPPGSANSGDTVVVAIAPGQFDCYAEGCAINYKIDDGKVEHWLGEKARGTTGAVILAGDGKWAAKLLGAKHLTIEAAFYGQGTRQFEFDVTGLKSPFPAPTVAKPRAAPKEANEWCYKVTGNPEPICWESSDECERNRGIAGDAVSVPCIGR